MYSSNITSASQDDVLNSLVSSLKKTSSLISEKEIKFLKENGLYEQAKKQMEQK